MRDMAASAAGVAVSVWLMAAPAVLGHGGSAGANDRIFGPTAAAIAWIAGSEVTRSARWANVAIGSWLAIAPLFLDHSPAAAINGAASGIALAVLALAMRSLPRDRYAGGWSALFGRHDQRDLPC